MRVRARAAVLGLALLGMTLVASHAGADPAAPPLTAAQQEKLSKIRAMFAPGAKSNWSGYGTDKLQEFCGAAIPLEVDPTTVAYDDPKKSAERSDVSMMCHGAGSPVAYTCGYNKDDDPVIKEMVRTNVKRIVCKSTDKADEMEKYGQKWSLENGTLTFTYLAGNPSDPNQTGMAFLSKTVKGPTGLSIGGQTLKRKMYESLSPKKETLHQRLKEECGIENLTVAIDDKLAEHFSNHLGHSAVAACDAGLQSVYNLCGRGDEFSRDYNKAAVKAAAQKYFKGISCVYSDTESIAIKPGGILELGHSKGAKRPNWEGRSMMSIHDYYMGWLSANHASFAQPGSSAAAPPSSSSPSKPRPKLVPRKPKP